VETRQRQSFGSFFLGDAITSPLTREQLKSRLLWRLLTMRPRQRMLVIALGVASTLVGLCSPWMQKRFVDGIVAGQSTQSLAITMLLAFATLFGSQVLMAVCRTICVRESTLAQRWLSSLLYEHTLRLDSRSRHARSVGETVTLYAQDVLAALGVLDDVLPNGIASVIPLVAAPVAIALMHDVPLWPPLLVSFLSVGTCLLLSKRQSLFFGRAKGFAEQRISVVNEWLQNMRAIRVLGWIPFFEGKIKDARVEESGNRLSMVTNGSTMNSVAQVAPFLVNVAGVLSFLSITGREVSPGDIFSMLWIFGVFLARPIRMLPWSIVVALDASTSARRLEKFFSLSVEPGDSLDAADRDESQAHAHSAAPRVAAPPVAPALAVQGLSLSAGERHLLFDISFQVSRGELIAIIGEVGAGKSLLLQSLLRETQAHFARYEIGGENALKMSLARVRRHFGYVPQDSFVMSATLRDNVSFEYGSSVEEDRVLESLALADFNPKGEQMEGGIETQIGERGVNLSGGQRQRVNLARAHFHGRDILLLDDSLSALDVDTENRVRHRLLQGAWKNRTRILVTHRLSILPHCDRVLFLEDGMLKETGRFDELLDRSEAVRNYVSSLSKAIAAVPSAQDAPVMQGRP